MSVVTITINTFIDTILLHKRFDAGNVLVAVVADLPFSFLFAFCFVLSGWQISPKSRKGG